MILKDIITVLKSKDKIAILPHISVDGDGLGSSLALALALLKLGKKVKVYLEEGMPFTFGFLPGQHLLELYNNEGYEETGKEESIKNENKNEAGIEVAVALDTGDEGRLGKRIEIFKKAKVTINIDHHATNSMYAEYNLVKTENSAVGEIIYQLIKEIGIEIDTDISICLYVAILTDTGGFKYSNTTALTHQITSDLISNGIDVAEISKRIFDTNSYEKIKLMGYAIAATELFEGGKVAFTAITQEILEASGAKDEDSDGIVNIGRSIKDVEVAVVVREYKSGEYKVNFRSNAYVDVSEIAVGFSGGGHKRAAGCKISGNIEEVKQKLLEKIRIYL